MKNWMNNGLHGVARACLVFVATAMGALGSPAARADVIYSYSGAGPYSSFCNGTYGTTPNCVGSVSGSITVAGSGLGANVTDAIISPLAFLFSDGVSVTLSSSMAIAHEFFQFSTDALGNIIKWNVLLDVQDSNGTFCISPNTVLGSYGNNATGSQGDFSCYLSPSGTFGAGSIDVVVPPGSIGSWTSGSAVSEPSVLLLLVAGLASLFLRHRRHS